ncbi:MAG: hypothetical protein RL519_2024 [Pseudomonadota bacterium]
MDALYQILPAVAVVLVVGAMLGAAGGVTASWRFAAAVCALFTGWSLYTIAAEGPFGFWPNHSQNAWGNQVWLDLLIAIGIGWALLLPRARAVGMRPLPWLALIVCSGCIGLTAMLARCRYLEARRP